MHTRIYGMYAHTHVGGCSHPVRSYAEDEHARMAGKRTVHRRAATFATSDGKKGVPLTFPCSVGSNISGLARSAVVLVEFNSLHSLSSQLSHIAALYPPLRAPSLSLSCARVVDPLSRSLAATAARCTTVYCAAPIPSCLTNESERRGVHLEGDRVLLAELKLGSFASIREVSSLDSLMVEQPGEAEDPGLNPGLISSPRFFSPYFSHSQIATRV